MRTKDLPNLVTLARILLALSVYIWLAGARDAPATSRMLFVHLALSAFVIAGLTDFLDGWLARRLEATSSLGATLDPIADKIAVVAAIMGIEAMDPGLVATPGALILARELIVSGLRETGVKLAVTRLAKWKTTVQMAALGLCIAAQGWSEFRSLAQLILWLAAALTLWTGVQYLRTALTARRT